MKSILRNTQRLIICLSLPVLLTCCTPKLYKDYTQQVDQTNNQADTAYQQKPTLESHLGPVSLDVDNHEDDAWLNSKISIRAHGMTFSMVANKIVQGTPASNAFDQTVNQAQPIDINYQGTRKGALSVLATQSGYAYSVSDHIVTWSTLVTKTFDVSFMPGSSKYLVGESNTNTTSSSSSGGSSAAGAPINPSSLGSNGEYSSIQGDLSVWNDLDAAVKTMLSKDGKVNVSQSTTTITVVDHPENVQNIEQYLKKMNRDMSRQVALDVQVLEVNLDQSFSYGIDWNLVRNFMSGRYSVALNNTSSGQTTVDPLATTAPDTLMFSAASGVWSGTQTFINALEQQGKVSVATQPRVVTLNNQVAEIGINTQTTYLAQVSTTSTQVSTTTALTPGQITSGFTLYLLPKIQGNNVYLQISSTLASILSITPQCGTNGGCTDLTTAGSSTQTSNSNVNTIYAPVVAQKHFNQRTVVPSNTTLVLAGFKQLNTAANKSKILGSDQLGGFAGKQSNVETIVLITPTVLNLKG